MRTFNTILVTGGAGFIGSNLIHYLFDKAEFKGRVVNLDALTYAATWKAWPISRNSTAVPVIFSRRPISATGWR